MDEEHLEAEDSVNLDVDHAEHASGRRAIGCDREDPCSNCTRGHVKCTYTVIHAPKPKRQRVLISTQYERKIDRIEERLSQVVDLLQGLTITSNRSLDLPQTNLPSREKHLIVPAAATPPKQPSSTPAASSVHSFTASSGPSDETQADHFEGESSMAAQTDFANKFVQKAVRSTPIPEMGGEIKEILSALQHIIDTPARPAMGANRGFTHVRPQSPGRKDRPLPSTQLAMSSLKIAKDRPDIESLWMSGYITQEHFTECAIGVYFSPDFSDAEYITVNVGFSWLFKSLQAIDLEQETPNEAYQADLQKQIDLCCENTETALAQLPYQMPNNEEHIMALGFAALYVMEMGKPSMAWDLLSSSLRMAENLGWHRLDSMANDPANARHRKIRIFWAIYSIEKALSLRLGRASAVRDFDISLQMSDDLGIETDDPWKFFLGYWVKVASIQGRIYEWLYSPLALKQTDDIRAARATSLASELKAVMESMPDIPHSKLRGVKSNRLNSSSFLYQSQHVGNLALLTMIYRAMPVPKNSPSTFTQECIESARLAIRYHHEVADEAHRVDGRAILYIPFIPFIVIFCHVIETSNLSDLELLQSFINTLKTASGESDAIGRLNNLAQVLHHVASKYIEVKSNTDQMQSQKEFDSYIHALGFGGLGSADMTMAGAGVPIPTGTATVPTAALHEAGQSGSLEGFQPGMNPQHGAMLGEWFSSSQHMMGLLEQDTFLDFEM